MFSVFIILVKVSPSYPGHIIGADEGTQIFGFAPAILFFSTAL